MVERSPAERLLGADLGSVDWQQKLAPLQQEGRGAAGGQGVAKVIQSNIAKITPYLGQILS